MHDGEGERETDPLLKSIIDQLFEGIRGFLSTLFDKYDLHNVGNENVKFIPMCDFPFSRLQAIRTLNK